MPLHCEKVYEQDKSASAWPPDKARPRLDTKFCLLRLTPQAFGAFWGFFGATSHARKNGRKLWPRYIAKISNAREKARKAISRQGFRDNLRVGPRQGHLIFCARRSYLCRPLEANTIGEETAMAKWLAALVVAPILTAFAWGNAMAAGPTPHRHAAVTLIASETAATPGKTLTVAVWERLEPGWHTYWINPGDFGEPTAVEWTLPARFGRADPVAASAYDHGRPAGRIRLR